MILVNLELRCYYFNKSRNNSLNLAPVSPASKDNNMSKRNY